VIKNYKIGVLYCKEGQSQEDEMFCNGTHMLSNAARAGGLVSPPADTSLLWSWWRHRIRERGV
jgi:hypothetical protein